MAVQRLGRGVWIETRHSGTRSMTEGAMPACKGITPGHFSAPASQSTNPVPKAPVSSLGELPPGTGLGSTYQSLCRSTSLANELESKSGFENDVLCSLHQIS